MRALASAGIGRAPLTLAAARIRRSRDALVEIAETFLSRHFCVSPLGRGECSLEAFLAQPEDIQLRVLARIVGLIGGGHEAPRLARVERLLESLRAGKKEATLGGSIVLAASGRLRFYREPGRMRREAAAFAPGASNLWDERFLVSFPAEGDRDWEVRQLGAHGWALYKKAMKEKGGCASADRLAALTTPALWQGNRLICAPMLDFDARPGGGQGKPVEAALIPRLAVFFTPVPTETASMLGKDSPIPYL